MIEGLEELTISEACETLLLKPRRYYRWLKWQPPAKQDAWNRLMPEEEAEVVKAGRDEKLCDLRSAGLMVYGQESGKFFCSVATVQRVLRKHALQTPYVIPTRKRPAKPDVRELMKEPKKIFSYDATDFYLTNRLKVLVIPILDMGSRKFIHYGVRVRSFAQKDVMVIWDEALIGERLDASQLTALSDRGGPMKGSRTKAHLIGKWEMKLEYARPYTPDDNAWIEAFIKYLKYHPECPEQFETVQAVIDWVEKFKRLYNDHPHSALNYVRPNEEHAGLGNSIRQQRKENLILAKQKRLEHYKMKKEGVSNYGVSQENASSQTPAPCFEVKKLDISEKVENRVLEELTMPDGRQAGGEDFVYNSSLVLCQNR